MCFNLQQIHCLSNVLIKTLIANVCFAADNKILCFMEELMGLGAENYNHDSEA